MSSETCNHQCESCQEDCSDRSFLAPANKHSNIKKVIGVVSGKGGVGKSSITTLLALAKAREGHRVAILDGDITGPSIPKAFGIDRNQLYSNGEEIIPAHSDGGIKIMSTNLLLEHAEDPVIWRGPILGGMIKQFWTDVRWGDIDYLFIDMPPGTGDVPLTIFQSIPLDGVVIVTTPQQLVSMIVKKAVNMARQMNIPILGVVENMSYIECPDCGKKISIFGQSHIEEIEKQYDLDHLGQIPLNQSFTELCDLGLVEQFDAKWFNEWQEYIKKI